MNPFLHPHALVEEGAHIGPKTRVWAFIHILPGANIAENIIFLRSLVVCNCGSRLAS